jgi:hypothetical protein
VEQIYNHYNGLATADKPGKLSITRQRVDLGTSLRYQYNLLIQSDATIGEVTAE